MIYTIERRVEFDGGTAETHYEVWKYDHKSKVTGALVGGQPIYNCKTKKEAKQFCTNNNIEL